MKIALITYEYPPDTACGGIATYVRQAAMLLASRGHCVEVFTASPHRSGHFQESGVGVNLVAEMDRDRFSLAVEPIFSIRHREVAFDVVESPEYNADGSVILTAHPQIPHLVKLHTPNRLLNQLNVAPALLSGRLRHHWSEFRMAVGAMRRFQLPRPYRPFRPDRPSVSSMEQVELEYVKKSDFIVSPSTSLRDWAVREWSLDISRTMVVPYPYLPNERLLQLKVESPGKTVGYFGRIEHRKGVADLLDAIPLVLAEEPEARFRFVGRAMQHPGTLGPYDEYLRRRLRRYRHALDFVGAQPLDAMPEQYAGVDVCVYPSLWENFPNVCLEAMSAARAIVASHAGGMAEMLEGGACGLLIPPHDPPAIAAAVIRLLRDRNLREELGRKARVRLLHAYSADSVGPQLEKSYESAIHFSKIKHAKSSSSS